MTEPVTPAAHPPSLRAARRDTTPAWARVVGYFVVFFAAMVLMGILFSLGGVTIILLPGAVAPGVAIGYILVSIAGSVLVSLLLANRIFRVSAPAPAGASPSGASPVERRSRTPSLLGWIAGISGTVIGGVLSAALSTLALRWIGR